MKFGIYSSIANPPRGEDLPRCVDEVIEEARLAEQAGFDSCFFGEHHQDKDGFLPSPLIVCAAVAASTTTLRVGTSVILLPLHHPVRLAEDVVTLDVISNGRVTVGVGLGYQPVDYQAFGIDMSDRVELFEEKVEILLKCWSGQEFSYDGKHHKIENLRVRPDPVQTPHPPIWIGASAPVSCRRAGIIGDALVTTPSTTLENTCRLIGEYRRSAEAAGKQPHTIIMRDAWVANSRQEAEEGLRPGGAGGLPVLPDRQRPADTGRPRRVFDRISEVERGYRRRVLFAAIEARPFGRAVPRPDHEDDRLDRRPDHSLHGMTGVMAVLRRAHCEPSLGCIVGSPILAPTSRGYLKSPQLPFAKRGSDSPFRKGGLRGISAS